MQSVERNDYAVYIREIIAMMFAERRTENIHQKLN